MVTVLLAAAMFASIPAPTEPAQPASQPAMWVVGDEDTTIYLFGTFHALDGRTHWFNAGVRSAFDSSGELVLETLLPSMGQARPSPQVQGPAGPPIKAGASFLASTRMALSAGHSRGLSVEKGADAVLRNAADATGKPVSGIETFEFQMQMFAQIPPSPAPRLTAQQSHAAMDSLARTMAVMQDAWNRGDGRVFADMLDEMRSKSPDTYRILFVERNARWADWVRARLDRPGTVFVAVGAGHLAGPDSLQNRLAQLGVRSARIN